MAGAPGVPPARRIAAGADTMSAPAVFPLLQLTAPTAPQPTTIALPLVFPVPPPSPPPCTASSLSDAERDEAMRLFRSDFQGAGDRWAILLRRLYPNHGAKLISTAIGVTPRTVESWLAGQAPQLRHLLAVADLHGEWVVAEVCAAGSRWHAELELLRRLADTERQLAQIRHALTGDR